MFLKFACVITATFLLSTSPVSADEKYGANWDGESDPLANVKMSKSDVAQGLEALKNSGKISNEDYEKAKKELAGLNDSQISGLTDQAVNLIRKDPDKAVDLVNKPKIDFKEVEKELK